VNGQECPQAISQCLIPAANSFQIGQLRFVIVNLYGFEKYLSLFHRKAFLTISMVGQVSDLDQSTVPS
jgi:hypothetical protein